MIRIRTRDAPGAALNVHLLTVVVSEPGDPRDQSLSANFARRQALTLREQATAYDALSEGDSQ